MPAIALVTGEVERTVLANGVRVVTEVMPHVRSVAAGIWVGSGSRSERPDQNGLCHFIEHMLFKGTNRRSAEEIARDVDSIGGNVDAFTAKELVGFNTKVMDEHLPAAFDVVADLVLNPIFRHEDIERERQVILEELKMEADNPEYLIHEIFSANFWKDHPIGRPILGTRDTVRGFDRDAVLGFYSHAYTGSNLTITAAGNLAHEQIVALARRYFEGVPRGTPLDPGPVPDTHARVAIRSKRELEQVHLCLGVPSYSLTDRDRFIGYILNTILGGGMSSRLFQTIRERQGLAYAVFSELSPYRDTGALCIYAGTSLEHVGRVISSIMSEFTRLKEEYVPDEEMRRAVNYLKGSLLLSLESTTSRMSNLARQELYFGRFFTVDELVACVEAVTREDVMRVAQSFFVPRHIAVSILGNIGALRVAREDLAC
ncbi:MAG TPA: pitrilysin family protein [Bryobacteraceae bacterium]|nr:pitrilysin family protein [Bryobacteraceae bacterium]